MDRSFEAMPPSPDPIQTCTKLDTRGAVFASAATVVVAVLICLAIWLLQRSDLNKKSTPKADEYVVADPSQKLKWDSNKAPAGAALAKQRPSMSLFASDALFCGCLPLKRAFAHRACKDIQQTHSEIPKNLPAGMDLELHISGLSAQPRCQWPAEMCESLSELRRSMIDNVEFRRHELLGVCSDRHLVRFLIARNGDVSAATAMLKRALAWRTHRMPYWLLADPASDVAKSFEEHGRTGTIMGCGQDSFGRGIMVLDNSAEITGDGGACMRYLAYHVEAALATCAPGVDKICVICQLDEFSILNNPPLSVTRETILILSTVFPETMGTCIVWQPPKYFFIAFGIIKHLVDAKTLSKIVLVSGDSHPGTENDRMMTEYFGRDWRTRTGLGLPRTESLFSKQLKRKIVGARGYVHASAWHQILARDRQRAEQAGCPPWSLDWQQVIDESQWDGAYPEFWATNLRGHRTQANL